MLICLLKKIIILIHILNLLYYYSMYQLCISSYYLECITNYVGGIYQIYKILSVYRELNFLN